MFWCKTFGCGGTCAQFQSGWQDARGPCLVPAPCVRDVLTLEADGLCGRALACGGINLLVLSKE